MNILTENSFWYAAAGLVSAMLAVILTHITLECKRKPIFAWLSWGLSLACYFVFAWLGCRLAGPQWYDYFIFFGWMIFLCTFPRKNKLISALMTSVIKKANQHMSRPNEEART